MNNNKINVGVICKHLGSVSELLMLSDNPYINFLFIQDIGGAFGCRFDAVIEFPELGLPDDIKQIRVACQSRMKSASRWDGPFDEDRYLDMLKKLEDIPYN